MSWMRGLSCEALEYYLGGVDGELAALDAHQELVRRVRERESIEEMIERLESLGYAVLSPSELSCDTCPWCGAPVEHGSLSEDRMRHVAMEAVRGAIRARGLDPLVLRPDEALQIFEELARSQDTCVTRWYCQCTDRQLSDFEQAWGEWQIVAARREAALANGEVSAMLSWARSELR